MTTYNGWTNYETWRVNLEVTSDYLDTLARDDDVTFSDTGELADHLEEYVDEVLTGFGEVKEGLALDYARAFVREVNWYEIAEGVLSDYPNLKTSEDDE